MNERNIKWWENLKRGDKLEMDVDANEPNAWVFSNKKNTDVFFDEISYPPESLRNIADPAPKFQRSQEDLGKSNKGYLLRLENLKRVRTLNGEPIKKTKKLREVQKKSGIKHEKRNKRKDGSEKEGTKNKIHTVEKRSRRYLSQKE